MTTFFPDTSPRTEAGHEAGYGPFLEETMNRTSRRALTLLALPLVVAIAACGGGDDDDAEPTTTVAAATDDTAAATQSAVPQNQPSFIGPHCS